MRIPHRISIPVAMVVQAIAPFPRLCIAFDNLLVFYGEQMLAHRKITAWKTTLYRLSATYYSVSLHLLPRIYPKFENASHSGDSRHVKAVCGSYSTAALRHIVLFPE